MPERDASIRMLVLDIDGTLLRPDRTIAPRVRDAVRAAAGIMPVVLATARPPRSVRAIAADLGLTTPQVNYNGALVWDPHKSEAIDHVPLSAALCARLIARTRTLCSHSVLGIEHLDKWYTDRIDERFTTETGKLFPPDFIQPVEQLSLLGATKMMFHTDPHEIDALRAALEPDFQSEVSFIRTDPDLLQMMNGSTSKWIGVQRLATRLGVEARDILSIGDNENDLDMIRGSGIGVAMANGSAAAKASAKWIAPSNEDDGVAESIDRFILRRVQ